VQRCSVVEVAAAFEAICDKHQPNYHEEYLSRLLTASVRRTRPYIIITLSVEATKNFGPTVLTTWA
jgi:hypothetical protein